MSNWFFDDDDDKPEPASNLEEPERPYDVTGLMECQGCGKYVHGAYIRRGTHDLVWFCSCGHVSEIKEFV